MTTVDMPSAADFERLANLVHAHCGIRLGSHKKAMLVSRLSKVMRQKKISDYAAYYERIRLDHTGEELEELIHAITTHVTHFFREPIHFEWLGQWFKQWEKKGTNRLRIWSAACATGEEPFSVAITAKETLQDVSHIKILATDISTHVIREARVGRFGETSLKETYPHIRARYFKPVQADKSAVCYQVDPTIINMVRFGPMNLAATPYPMKGSLDLILCRNVMIYFDNDVRKRILAEMYRLLKPSGFLLVGQAESLSGMLSSFKPVAPSVYVRHGLPPC